MSNPVHNHGTEEGPGLACRERVVDGRRVGECVAKERGLLTCPRCYPRLCGCTTPAQTPEELSELWTRLAQLAVELEDAGDYYSRDVVCLAQYAVEELSAMKGVPL